MKFITFDADAALREDGIATTYLSNVLSDLDDRTFFSALKEAAQARGLADAEIGDNPRFSDLREILQKIGLQFSCSALGSYKF